MREIKVSKNKSFRLTNVLIRQVEKEEAYAVDKIVNDMENYIRLKGGQPVGPLVQYTETVVDDEGRIKVITKLMRQSNNFINNIESPYEMKSLIRCKNCMYVRFVGEEYAIKFAYDKMHVIAYEEEIDFKGSSYTIFVDRQQDNLVADIFMECNENE